ncbi:EAL domain-containing protein [Caldicellulosiruptor changbaiensis]|uniref:EAL domain-containing protein n=1 Tax=Caldicellulosiruptor changbaiensis TaxID=1222016 RepID=A0A3T0D208_9FIRM|nr:EAL domain-containing protein [Caldicellulosiruptor changbaiensis]AZT89218.1 EAL domain-containing protein [Caldicellulosiruptor changbaiensis]
MKRTLKVIIISILLFLFTSQVAYCYHKTIKFQVDKQYPPFSYVINGRVYGFSVDLANLIFEPDKYFLSVSSDTWENVYKRLVSGEIDITGPIVILEERKKGVYFTDPIFTRHVGIYTRKDFNKDITLNNLASFKIGVMKSDYTETLLKERLKIKNYLTFQTIEDEFVALLEGKVDAVIISQEIANYFLVKNNYADQVEIKLKDIFILESGFGISKKHPELVDYVNTRLKELIKNGIFDQLYYNYFSTYSPYYYEKKNREVVFSILYILFIIIFASSITIFVMRGINKRLQQGKEAYEKYAELLASNANVIVLTLNLKGEIIYFNRFAEEVTGYKREEVIGKRWVDIFIPEHKREYIEKLFSEIAEKKVLNNFENEIITKTGDVCWIIWNNVVVESPYLNEPLIISTGLDITPIKKNQRLLEESYEELEETNQELVNTLEILNKQTELLKEEEERYKFIVENISDCIWEFDVAEKRIEFYGNLKDYFETDKINPKIDYYAWLELYHPDDIKALMEKIQRAFELRDEKIEYEARIKDKNGNYKWVSVHIKVFYDNRGKPEKLIGINIDYSAKKEYEDRIKYLAYYDDLTNLPNRKLFENKLSELIKKAAQTGKIGAVILIDIDNFKDINDLYGHEVGDEYLRTISQKIAEYLKGLEVQNYFSRVGGDEFAIILNGLEKKDFVIEVCTEIQKIFENEIFLEKIERGLYTTVSMGISFYPEDGRDSKEILRNVDMALSLAKENGKNDFQIFMPFLLLKNLNKIEIEKNLRKAIENDEFVLYYQPVVNLENMEIHSVEALIRWFLPQKGMVSPLEFIPVAEESGLIVRIGEVVIEKALRDLRDWERKGINDIHIAINLSARQFKTKYFENTVAKLLEKYSVDPVKVSFEITETGAVENFDVSLKILGFLCQMGIKFLIDDFGTGYSSLIYLRKLPISGVKIDKSFISELMFSKESRAIVEGIILMAHKLGLKVVAEGIENKKELEILKEIGCDFGQGYLFSKPIPKEEVEKLLLQKKVLM